MTKRKPKGKPKVQEFTHDALPASVGLVKEVREELRAEIRGVDHKIKGLDHKVEALDHKVDAVQHNVDNLRFELSAKIEGQNAKFEELNSKIEVVTVAVHRTQVLMEEQRSENRIVLDGLKTVIERQDRVEADVRDLQDTVKSLRTSV